LKRIKNIQFDKEYKEHHEQVDALAMEKQIEDELQPKEGEEPIDEDTKQLMARKLRFKLMTKGFFAPHAPNKKVKKVKEGKHHK
jgi:hypothetical protein